MERTRKILFPLKNKTWELIFQATKFSPSVLAYIMGIKLLLKSSSYLHTTGYLCSYKRGRPCQTDGSPLPWMPYSIIAFLRERLDKTMTLFEFGSGQSTLFFAGLVAHVTAVEHDEAWYGDVKRSLPSNARILLCKEDSKKAYPQAIAAEGKLFDVVVIDGLSRVECAKTSCNYLTQKGVIIFDDSHRLEYKEGVRFIRDQGFKRIDFEGLKPLGFYNDTTTIFYRSVNCLDI